MRYLCTLHMDNHIRQMIKYIKKKLYYMKFRRYNILGAFKDLSGQRFGMLTAIEYVGNSKWKAVCECGKEIIWHRNTLIKAKSCGCQRAVTMRKIGIERKNIKKCVVCGTEFNAPPSSKKKTCSKECSSRYRTMFSTGSKRSEATKLKMSEKAQKRENEQLKLGTPAAQKSEKAGRFETNSSAKEWVLMSPDKEIYSCTNLMEFIRQNIELFGCELTDKNVQRIAHGFFNIKKNIKRKKGSVTYKDWTLIDWCDQKNVELNNK